MCLRRSAVPAGLLVLLTALALAAAPPAHRQAQGQSQDAVEAFLKRHDLTDLRVRLLRDQLRTAPESERERIAERLAPLYAEMLEDAESPRRRAELVRLSRQLLSAVPAADSLDLRLSLLRVTYLQAERVAERARLRLASPEEVREAQRTLGELASDFDVVGRRANQQVLALQRQEEAEGDIDRELVRRELREARRHRSLAFYLAGWSNLYMAELTENVSRAREALTQFGWLLGAAPGGMPDLDRFPESTLQFEHVARAAVGAAMCYALLNDAAAALDWFDTVAAAESVPAEVETQLPARRMTLLAALRRWEELAGFVESRRRAGSLPATEARLLAILALDAAASGGRDAPLLEDVARVALADLIERREVAHVVDLATIFGAAPIGSTGFVAQYVRGVRAYDRARTAHRAQTDAPDAPTADPALRRSYEQAAASFGAALGSADAADHQRTQGDAALYLGFSLYYGAGQGRAARERLVRAADAFEQAASILEDVGRVADARWMAMRALTEAIDRGAAQAEALAQRRAALQSEFLANHASDPRVSTIMIQRAAAPNTPAREAVEILLAVPESSPGWESARRRAARLLYDLYRHAPQDQRDWAALRYAAVAERILAIDQRQALAGDASSAARAAVRARRVLDALLSVASPDADRADAALDALEALLASGRVDAAPLRAELAFRRAQIALARGDIVTAEAAIDRLRARAERESGEPARRALRFADAGDRLLYERAVRRWEQARRRNESESDRLEAARAVVRRGARVVVDMDAASGDFSDEANLSLYVSVAHAAFDVWSITDEESALRLSDRLHQRLLAARPLDRGVLRRSAELAEAVGDLGRARDAWRHLASGLPADSDQWFEARYRLIRVLAELDPQRAAVALRQHRALHPSLGHTPWNKRFRELERELAERLPDADNGATNEGDDS